MSEFVCTANSFGDIDYKEPVGPSQYDYRTSTGHYHRLLSAITTDAYRLKPVIAANSLIRDSKLCEEYYKTTYRENYIPKYQKPRGNEVYTRAGRCNKIQYAKTAKERFFKDPPPPVKLYTSETHVKFVPKKRYENDEFIPPATICRIQSTGGDEEPRIKIETLAGQAKLMDPYVSCTRLAHVPFTPEQIHKSNANNISTYYTSKKEPPRCVKKEPVFDKTQFNFGIKDRILRPIICRVPYVGLSTEYSSKYIPPTTYEIYTELDFCPVLYPEYKTDPDMYQTLCPPAMYCRDSCHVGTGWPVRSVVNSDRGPDRVIAHDIPCYTPVN